MRKSSSALTKAVPTGPIRQDDGQRWLTVCLLASDGKELPARLAGEPARTGEECSRVLSVRQPNERFVFWLCRLLLQ